MQYIIILIFFVQKINFNTFLNIFSLCDTWHVNRVGDMALNMLTYRMRSMGTHQQGSDMALINTLILT